MSQQYFSATNSSNIFSSTSKLIGSVNVGEQFTVECINGFGKHISHQQEFKDYMETPEHKTNSHPATGPIEISGINPSKHALAVHIKAIRIAKVLTCISKSTGIKPNYYKGRHCQIYNPNANGSLTLENGIEITPQASIGFITTIAEHTLKAAHCYNHGGNLDCPLLQAGSTIYLPLKHHTALLAVGDVHFRQGAGEIAGIAMEADAEVDLVVEQCTKVHCPIIETDQAIAIVGSGNTLVEAKKNAVDNAITYLSQDSLFSQFSAAKIYKLLGSCADLVPGNITGSTPTMAVSINKQTFNKCLATPQIEYAKYKRNYSSICRAAVANYRKLPLFHQGDSREIRVVDHKRLIAKLKPQIYSYEAAGTIALPGTEYIRAKLNQYFSNLLHSNGVQTSTLATNGNYILMQKYPAADNIEVIVKAALIGNPLYSYPDITEVKTRTGSYLQNGTAHAPYVRFDWRVAPPGHDSLLPEGLASYFINTSKAASTALKAFKTIKYDLQRYNLDLHDGCFFMNQAGDVILGEVSPDNLASIHYTGNIQSYQEVFNDPDKQLCLAKWELIAQLIELGEDFEVKQPS